MPQTYDQVQAAVDATFAQLLSVQTLKASLIAQKAALIAANTADPGNISQSGTDGSESYGLQTLVAQIDEITKVEQELTAVYEDQLRIKQAMFPFDLRQRVGVGGGWPFGGGRGPGYGGWW